jgi:hypothetical protein
VGRCRPKTLTGRTCDALGHSRDFPFVQYHHAGSNDFAGGPDGGATRRFRSGGTDAELLRAGDGTVHIAGPDLDGVDPDSATRRRAALEYGGGLLMAAGLVCPLVRLLALRMVLSPGSQIAVSWSGVGILAVIYALTVAALVNPPDMDMVRAGRTAPVG